MGEPLDLNSLRGLALSLPPSERVSSSEAGDVLSALIAVGVHGDALVQAAQDGTVYDFYHQSAVDSAQEAGTPEPVRGDAHVAPAPTAPAQPAQPTFDYDKLAQAMIRAQNAQPSEETASDGGTFS